MLLQCKLQICVNREFLVCGREGQFWICISFSALLCHVKVSLCAPIIYTYFRNRQTGEKVWKTIYSLVLKVKTLRELTDPIQLTESLQAFRHPCLLVPHNADVRGDTRTLERRRSLSPSQELSIPPNTAPGSTETRGSLSYTLCITCTCNSAVSNLRR